MHLRMAAAVMGKLLVCDVTEPLPCGGMLCNPQQHTLHHKKQLGGALKLEGPPAGQQALPKGGVGDDLLLQGRLCLPLCLLKAERSVSKLQCIPCLTVTCHGGMMLRLADLTYCSECMMLPLHTDHRHCARASKAVQSSHVRSNKPCIGSAARNSGTSTDRLLPQGNRHVGGGWRRNDSKALCW